MANDVLSVIPAKKESLRLPNKNILKIKDKELWLYSVEYAIHEGTTPIVTTDSEYIIQQCIDMNILYNVENVDDSNMVNCVLDVINKNNGYDIIALLQPTSPLRKPGMLKMMANYTKKFPSVYTANKVKMIGHIGDVFNIAYRDQDTNKFLYQFDGNIVVVRKNLIKHEHCLFNNDSGYIVNDRPYSLQIDTYEDYNILKTYIEHSGHVI